MNIYFVSACHRNIDFKPHRIHQHFAFVEKHTDEAVGLMIIALSCSLFSCGKHWSYEVPGFTR